MCFYSFFQTFVWFIIIPYLLGKYFEKKEDSVQYTWIIGHTLQMAIFIILAVPMILLKLKFQMLRDVYYVVILLISFVSAIMYKDTLIKINTKKSVSIYKIIAIVLICVQVFIRFKYSTVNNDDSSFVVLSNSMIQSGEMYISDNVLNARRALAPISAYYAVLSQYINVHTTIVTHTFIPILYTIIVNIVYYFLGKKLFEGDKESAYIFIIVMFLVNLYFFRIKGAGAYLLKYPWLGRVILANAFLPFLWKISIDVMDINYEEKKGWFLILSIILASCLCSEMSIALVSVSLLVLSIVNAYRDKNIKYVLKSLICVIPCVILAVIYMMIK